MIIYDYDVKGYYIGSRIINANDFMPINSTKIKPPTVGEHQIMLFEINDWRVKNDFREVHACQIDENGVYIEEYQFILGEVPSDRTPMTAKPTEVEMAFYETKWDGSKWVEGLTQEEIDAVILNTAKTPIEAAQTIAEINSQLDEIRANIDQTNATVAEFMNFILSTLG